MIRFKIWRERRIARLVSKHASPDLVIVCQVRDVTVGKFVRGKEVNR